MKRRMSNLPWDEEHPYTHFSSRFNPGTQTILKQALVAALRPVVEDEPVVEFFEEVPPTLTIKVRGKWNDWLEGLPLEDLVKLLQQMRKLLNAFGYKTAKLQCSIHEGKYEGKTNIRIIYNPAWRRYENYEIFFRNKTQSRRKHS